MASCLGSRAPVSRWLAILVGVAVAGCGDGSKSTAGPNAAIGVIEVTTSTTGVDLDPDGYRLIVDGSQGAPIGRDGSVVLSRLRAGTHELDLGDVAGNCAIAGERPRTVSVSAGSTARLGFEIDCGPIPPLLNRIVWASDRSGDFQKLNLHHMNPDGSGVVRLTTDQGSDFGYDSYPAVSPDGKRVAFRRYENFAIHVYVVHADGSEEYRLASDGEHPSWSPDGTKLAFASYDGRQMDIAVINADGTGRTIITNTPSDNDRWPRWSPDGTRIAFMHWDPDSNRDIYVMNADGSDWVRLTTDPANDSEPAWSPDGERIAFVTDRDGNYEIYVMNADGSGKLNLTNNQAADIRPAWSPDGTKIVFVTARNGRSELCVMSSDGTGQTILIDNSAGGAITDDYPVWAR